MNSTETIEVLTITAESVVSTDTQFTMDQLDLGDGYKPVDTYFKKSNGEIIHRKRRKSENKISNQTLPRLAIQIFERKIAALTQAERMAFPVCRYSPDKELICGIFSSEEEFKKYKNTIESSVYHADDGNEYVIYAWNIFSTLIFVQECLRRFGEEGDQFILKYTKKPEKDTPVIEAEEEQVEDTEDAPKGYRNPMSYVLIQSKNVILRGAPGTGKTYLAKEIAADIVSDGAMDSYMDLTDEQKKQVGFVQFHPNYDYSDFIEGLRPKMNDDGTIGFELQDGIFKRFVEIARKSYEDSKKTLEELSHEITVQDAINSFLDSIRLDEDEFHTKTNNTFYITAADERYIYLSMPDNPKTNTLKLDIKVIRSMLESKKSFNKVSDITAFFGKKNATQHYSYYWVIHNEIKKHINKKTSRKAEQISNKKYVFIIDEINRGEISRVLGELFFSIDPGYRGEKGAVFTQYSNMHDDEDEMFFIPENVYIIGTMNDIDRSVDSFDFAMRRRFRFIEIKANERLEMLDSLGEELKGEAVVRMNALNDEITNVEELNANYHIGPAYFLKLNPPSFGFEELWTDCLKPLLEDYIRGMYKEVEIMQRFEDAYNLKNVSE